MIPRLHDTLEVRAAAPGEDGTNFVVVDGTGAERLRVDEPARFVLLQLDGLRTFAELAAAFRREFGRDLSPARFAEMLKGLADDGLLVPEGRGLRALRYLRARGVSYRGPGRERRQPDRAGAGRRGDGQRALAFDQAVYLVNEGRLEHACALLETLARERPRDVRLRVMLGHLRFLLVSEQRSDLATDRRDVEWEAFDTALGELLTNGTCPRCELPLTIELGSSNRCGACGSSFSNYLFAQTSRRATR